MKIKEVIIVEGKSDHAKIIQAVEADVIETNGSAINQTTLKQIAHAQKKRGVIVFTDPDYPGQRIRQIIENEVPGCKHAFLTAKQAKAKHPEGKSIGIEHASLAAIKQALQVVYERAEATWVDEITKADLLQFGLIGSSSAKQRREKLTETLSIGYANGKQLLKRLNMFQITKEEFSETMTQIIKEEKDKNV